MLLAFGLGVENLLTSLKRLTHTNNIRIVFDLYAIQDVYLKCDYCIKELNVTKVLRIFK